MGGRVVTHWIRNTKMLGSIPGRVQKKKKLECGPMTNVMAAQPNTGLGGALCESSVIPFLVPRRKVWLRPAAEVPRSKAANIRQELIRR